MTLEKIIILTSHLKWSKLFIWIRKLSHPWWTKSITFLDCSVVKPSIPEDVFCSKLFISLMYVTNSAMLSSRVISDWQLFNNLSNVPIKLDVWKKPKFCSLQNLRNQSKCTINIFNLPKNIFNLNSLKSVKIYHLYETLFSEELPSQFLENIFIRTGFVWLQSSIKMFQLVSILKNVERLKRICILWKLSFLVIMHLNAMVDNL